MDMTPYKNETKELTLDDLDAVTGGSWLDTIVEVATTVAHIVTGNTGVFSKP
jgi:hypothetical protein